MSLFVAVPAGTKAADVQVWYEACVGAICVCIERKLGCGQPAGLPAFLHVYLPGCLPDLRLAPS